MNIEILTPKYFVLNCKYIVPGMTYEHYLVDVINGSSFFYQKKRLWERFELQENQAHGEDDAKSSLYGIDFKLLVDQDVMNAMFKNKPDIDRSHESEGFIFVKDKKDKVPVPSNNVLLDLMLLKESDIESENMSKTVKSLLENMEKEKNLFLYYPYEFSSKSDLPGSAFLGVLNNALGVIMNYRYKQQPTKDTFLCIKSNQWFLIYEWTPEGFICRDRVNELLCGNYRDAKLYSLY